jgi:hypothetical protein
VYAAARAGDSEVEMRTLLPAATANGDVSAALPPPHHMPPRDLMGRLSQELLLAEIAHALIDSLASENGPRPPSGSDHPPKKFRPTSLRSCLAQRALRRGGYLANPPTAGNRSRI